MRVLVIGGGIAGLHASRRLALAGHQVTLVESTPSLGGLIRQVSIAGLPVPVDVGAESFSVARPDTLNLIQDLGLTDQLEEPNPQGAVLRLPAGTIPIPHGILGIPSSLDGTAQSLGLTASQLAEAAQRDSAPWQLEQAGTVAQLVSTRLGDAVLQNLVAPVIAGVHSSRPENLLVDSVAPGLFAKAAQLGSLTAAVAELRAKASKPGSVVNGLRGGMHHLVSALVGQIQQLGVEIQLNAPVYGIEQSKAAANADLVVLATGPAAAARILAAQADLAVPLSQINALDTTVVALSVLDPQLNRQPNGTGVLVAQATPNLVAKASTHANAKWNWLNQQLPEDHHLIRLSYGRDGISPLPGPALFQQAMADLKELYGLANPLLLGHHMQYWPRSMIQARVGHLQIQNQIQTAAKKHRDLVLIGSGLGGNGITGILAQTNQQLERIGA